MCDLEMSVIPEAHRLSKITNSPQISKNETKGVQNMVMWTNVTITWAIMHKVESFMILITEISPNVAARLMKIKILKNNFVKTI